MSRPSSDNTTSNHNISTSSQQKAVFNYAQAARKSNPPVNTNGQPAPVNGGVKQPQQQQQQQQTQPQQQQPSFAAALQKSSNPYVIQILNLCPSHPAINC
jgi:hypothetical protein